MAAAPRGTAVPNPRKTYTIKITAGNRKRSILLVGYAVQILSPLKIIGTTCCVLNPLITDTLKLLPLPGPIRRPPSSPQAFAQALCITVTNACCAECSESGLLQSRNAPLPSPDWFLFPVHHRTLPVLAGFFALWFAWPGI